MPDALCSVNRAKRHFPLRNKWSQPVQESLNFLGKPAMAVYQGLTGAFRLPAPTSPP
jgi:hypothetical protein